MSKQFFIALAMLIVATPVQASTPVASVPVVISAYRQYKDVSPQVKVPTVVEVPFSTDSMERYDFAVLDTTTNTLESYLFTQRSISNASSLTAQANVGNPQNMIDGSVITFSEFPVSGDSVEQTTITITSSKPVTSSAITILLDNYVALPQTIEIRANGKVVIAKLSMNEQTVRFPKTTSSTWIITLTYGQPLRITELRLVEENTVQSSAQSLRFLAQPLHTYRIYFDPDRYISTPLPEAGNLASDQDVVRLAISPSQKNPTYVIADTDGDSIPDIHDNCVSISNTDQVDVNGNGRGDVCDDFDKDNVINSKDNCPLIPNRDQRDTDGDDIGDVCDQEESRITERYTWLPWVGMGVAAVVLIGLFAITAKSLHKKPDQLQ